MTLDPSSAPSSNFSGKDAAQLVYILYFVGFFLPICAVAGVILAYVKRDEAAPMARSHLDFQIRSFWIGFGAVILGGILTLVLIGWAVIALWTVWALVRFITGFLKLNDSRPVADPEGWGFAA
ncbi:DUF4870 family protein [Rhodovulum sp. DZ06]|uniref:DUF4870 family protein n=1 Tax=Rhodovulum sp. DZ06 TaxID=3425126 RepID=UPI003D356363